MVVERGKIKIPGYDLRYMQFYHGGKPLKEGTWCKLGEDGLLKRSTAKAHPQMLVVG